MIAAISVVIFVLRDKLQNAGEVSYLGLCVLCFLASVTILLPAPSLMLVASCALVLNPFLVALAAALGSTLGESAGYALGAAAQDLSPRFQKLLEKLAGKIHNQTLLVFLLAVLPLPFFDIIGIYSGGTKLHLAKFFGACFVGKFLKMLVCTRMNALLEWAISLI